MKQMNIEQENSIYKEYDVASIERIMMVKITPLALRILEAEMPAFCKDPEAHKNDVDYALRCYAVAYILQKCLDRFADDCTEYTLSIDDIKNFIFVSVNWEVFGHNNEYRESYTDMWMRRWYPFVYPYLYGSMHLNGRAF